MSVNSKNHCADAFFLWCAYIFQALDQQDTCFQDKADFTVKHPLQSRWVLWFDNPAAAAGRKQPKNWEDNLKMVGRFTF